MKNLLRVFDGIPGKTFSNTHNYTFKKEQSGLGKIDIDRTSSPTVEVGRKSRYQHSRAAPSKRRILIVKIQ